MLHIASVSSGNVRPDIIQCRHCCLPQSFSVFRRQQGFVGIPVGLLVVVAFSQQFQQCAQRARQWQSQQQQQCEQQQCGRAWISSVHDIMLGMKMAMRLPFGFLPAAPISDERNGNVRSVPHLAACTQRDLHGTHVGTDGTWIHFLNSWLFAWM